MKTCSLHKQAGLNLLEVLIAALVLSVGMLGLAGLQLASLKTAQNTTSKQQATLLINELLERMRSNRAGALAGDYEINNASCAGGSLVAVNCRAQACTAKELATYDLKETLCGAWDVQTEGGGISGQLLQADLSVSCATTAVACGDFINVTVKWVERIEQKEIVESKGANEEQLSLSLSVSL
ncbi:MAG: type IV pilus modification protein PilV [Proteobacteria bacterium]|nr:MAG: type IV pilus modification protein PilV [Pseudomonadota bacterium]